QLFGYGRSDWSAKLIRGLGSEAAAGFRSRRGDGHDRTPVAPHNAAFPTYKAVRPPGHPPDANGLPRKPVQLCFTAERQIAFRSPQPLAQRADQLASETGVFFDWNSAKAYQNVSPVSVHEHIERVGEGFEVLKNCQEVASFVGRLGVGVTSPASGRILAALERSPLSIYAQPGSECLNVIRNGDRHRSVLVGLWQRQIALTRYATNALAVTLRTLVLTLNLECLFKAKAAGQHPCMPRVRETAVVVEPIDSEINHPISFPKTGRRRGFPHVPGNSLWNIGVIVPELGRFPRAQLGERDVVPVLSRLQCIGRRNACRVVLVPDGADAAPKVLAA